jgi:methylthioribose-1-phosphate isomerase
MKVMEWTGSSLVILDQTKLPLKEVYLELKDPHAVGEAIKSLKVRGAPAIGMAAAYGMALAATGSKADSYNSLAGELNATAAMLKATRPTAVNLERAVDRIMDRVKNTSPDITGIKNIVIEEADGIALEIKKADEKMGRLGSDLIEDGDVILTYCNTGALATGAYGTALGVIKTAFEQGKKIEVIACETRPLLQGSRLTMWELKKAGIPATLIVDAAAGYMMSQGKVDKVIVGADRIAANGDTANKIGTYAIASLAYIDSLPFYIAAPTSTIDLSSPDGAAIPVEMRDADEVTRIMGLQVAPEGISAANPAFDITPCDLISAIITELGVIRPPFRESLKDAFT